MTEDALEAEMLANARAAAVAQAAADALVVEGGRDARREYQRLYSQREDRKEWRRQYARRPEVKARRNEKLRLARITTSPPASPGE